MLLLAVPIGLPDARLEPHDRERGAASRARLRERRARPDPRAPGAKELDRRSATARRRRSSPGFLEQNASAQKLQVTDSVDRPDVPHGKKYVERNTVIHLKKSGMAPIAKFLEAIEKSGYPLSISRLNVRKRNGEPDKYDLEVGISAFDRVEQPAAAPADDKKGP